MSGLIRRTGQLSLPAARLAGQLIATLLLLHFLIFDGGNRSRYDFDVALASQILAVAALGTWLAIGCAKHRAFPRTVLDGPIATYLAVVALGLVAGREPRVSLDAVPPILAGVLAFYLFVDLLRSGRARPLVTAVALITALAATLAILEFLAWYLGGLPAGLAPGEGTWPALAADFGWWPPIPHRSTYSVNANHLAALIALALPFALVGAGDGDGPPRPPQFWGGAEGGVRASGGDVEPAASDNQPSSPPPPSSSPQTWGAGGGQPPPQHPSHQTAPPPPSSSPQTWGAGGGRTPFRLALLPLLLVPLLLTFSRGGLIAAGVSVGVTLGLLGLAGTRRPGRRASILGLIAAGAGLIGLILPRDRLGVLVRPETLANRLPIWGPAVDFLLSSPIVGVGPGGFGLALAGYADREPLHTQVQLAHNGLLQIGAELGGLGIGVAAWCSVVVVRAWLARWPAGDRRERWRLAAIGGALAGFVAANVFDAYFTFQLVMIPVALLVAALIAPVRPGGGFGRGERRTWFVAGLAGLAAAATVALSDLGASAFWQARWAAIRGDWIAAEARLAEAASGDPTFTFYSRQLGFVRGVLAERASDPVARLAWAGAAAAADTRGERGAQPIDWANRARVAGLAGEPARAVEFARRAVAGNPWDPVLLANLGAAREAAGDWPGAVEAYAVAIARAPDFRRSRWWDESADRRARLPAIDRRVEEVLAEDRNLSFTDRAVRRVDVALGAGDVERAQSRAEAVPAEDFRGWTLRGRIAEQLGDLDAARQAYAEAWRRVPARDESDLARTAADLAALTARTGQPAAAEPLIRLARFYLVDPAIEFRTAQVARAAGDRERAIRHYRASLAVAIPERERFAPNALARAAILPRALPGLIQPAPTRDIDDRARALAGYLAE